MKVGGVFYNIKCNYITKFYLRGAGKWTRAKLSMH